MKHKLKISVSKAPDPGGVVSMKKGKFKNRILDKLFGTTKKTVLVIGDTVDSISIEEESDGGSNNAA